MQVLRVGAGSGRLARGQGGEAVAAGDAIVRLGQARSAAARTHTGGAEVHDRLGVVGHTRGRRVPPPRATVQFARGRWHPATASPDASASARAHVAVEDGHAAARPGPGMAPAVVGNRCRAGRRARRYRAAVRRRGAPGTDLCCALQVARATVVASPTTGASTRSGSAAASVNGRQGGDEAFEIADHGGDLGLLQHDFRHPRGGACAALTEGQVAAPVLVIIPDQQARGDRVAHGASAGVQAEQARVAVPRARRQGATAAAATGASTRRRCPVRATSVARQEIRSPARSMPSATARPARSIAAAVRGQADAQIGAWLGGGVQPAPRASRSRRGCSSSSRPGAGRRRAGADQGSTRSTPAAASSGALPGTPRLAFADAGAERAERRRGAHRNRGPVPGRVRLGRGPAGRPAPVGGSARRAASASAAARGRTQQGGDQWPSKSGLMEMSRLA